MIIKKKDTINVYLIGGNSVIGTSIHSGIIKKHEANNLIKSIFFARTVVDLVTPHKTVFFDNYLESIDFIEEDTLKNPDSKVIIIISFGVLKEEKNDQSLYENLIYHLDINTFQQIQILKKVKELNNLLEIHIVSSILSDFIRPSIYSYSISKNFLELMISNIFNSEKLERNLYIWKPAFVNSKLNHGREASFLRTSSDQITTRVSKTNSGGKFYIPRRAIFFSFIAKRLSFLVKVIDKNK